MTPISTHQAAVANQPLETAIARSQASMDDGRMAEVEETTSHFSAANVSDHEVTDARTPSESSVDLNAAEPKNGFLANAAIVGKHIGFAALGALPFIASAATYATYEFVNLASEIIAGYGQEGFSALDPTLDAVKNTAMVGAGLTAIGSMVSYPLGRFIMAPAAQKTYNVFMPYELKTVANDTITALPQVAKKGANAALRGLKEAHKTLPQALISTGLGIASLTEEGAKTAVQTVKEKTENKAQLAMAERNLRFA